MSFLGNLFGKNKPKVITMQNGAAMVAAVFRRVEGRTFSSADKVHKTVNDGLKKPLSLQVSCTDCLETFALDDNEQITQILTERNRITIHITCPKCQKRVTEDLMDFEDPHTTWRPRH